MKERTLAQMLPAACLLLAAPTLAAAMPAVPAPPAQSALLETPSRAFHTGNQVLADAYLPQHVASADMDADGDVDLVLAHAGNIVSPKVSVMFNVGDGSYGTPVTYAAPGQTMEVVLADFDGDGDQDAAFAQSNQGSAGNRVLVYENTGDGSLLPYVSYTVGTGPTGLIAVDVDLDGDLDLVSANNFWMQEDVSILFNNGNGVFPVRVDVPIPGEEPVKVAAGDLTGDGAPELVVSLESGNPAFAVLTNDGSGGFGAPSLYSTGLAPFFHADVAVADIDKDGDSDVLYGSSTNGGSGYTNGFALFRNAGGGVFGPHESIPTGPNFAILYDFAVADVTGDGWPDVMGTERQTQEGFVLVPGDGSGGFAPPTSYRAGEYSRAITTDDVDGDGDLDAIVTNTGSLTVTVHENDGSGFPTPPLFPLGAYLGETVAGDVDLDGDDDLLTSDWNSFWVLDNQGDGSFDLEEQPYPYPKLYTKLRDLDGDGAPDVLFAGAGLSRALNDGTGIFGAVESVPLSSAVGDVDTLDMDNDGDLDAVVTGGTTWESGFYALENDGTGTFGAPKLVASAALSSTGRIATGDFTGDGNADVVTATWKAFALWPGDGAGGFGGPIMVSLGSGGVANMATGDIDGDGHLDVAGSDWGTPPEGETLTVVFGNGDGTFTPPVTYLGMFSWWQGGVAGLTCADVDGDGDIDLVGGARAAADVAVFLSNGDRTFAPEQRYGVDGGVEWVVAGDFDGDGRADVAANIVDSSYEEGGVTVLLGASSGAFVDLGFALPGSAGVPALSGTGTPAAASPFTWKLVGGVVGAPGFLVVSPTRLDLPLFGGTLVPAPSALVPFVTGFGGGFTLNLTWPAGTPVGTTLYEQAWIFDGLAANGVSASNALQTTQQP